MNKNTFNLGPLLLAFVVISVVVVLGWALSKPDTSVPPTVVQEILFAYLCVGGAAALPLGILFVYLSSCYD